MNLGIDKGSSLSVTDQEARFSKFAKMAMEISKPLQIHARGKDAVQDVLRILREVDPEKKIPHIYFHWWSGNVREMCDVLLEYKKKVKRSSILSLLGVLLFP